MTADTQNTKALPIDYWVATLNLFGHAATVAGNTGKPYVTGLSSVTRFELGVRVANLMETR